MRRISWAAVLLSLAAMGCGNRLYPVHGKVILEDGKPLTKGLVVFESQGGEKPVTARGDVQPDGTYQLGTRRPGDGAPAGRYRVLISPRVDVDSPQPAGFDNRYMDFDTSGLTFEVKAGSNEYPIQLSRPGKRPH
jgi:hypothetical protein